MMRLCYQSRPFCSFVSRPAAMAAAVQHVGHARSARTTMHAVCSSSLAVSPVVNPASIITHPLGNTNSLLWCPAVIEAMPRSPDSSRRYTTIGIGVDPGVLPGPPGIPDPGTGPGISPRQPGIDPGPIGVPDIDPGTPPSIDPRSVPGGVPDPGVSPGIDPAPPGLDPGSTPGIDPGVISPGDPSRFEFSWVSPTSSASSQRPREGSFPADLGSEAIAVDEATIDAIPDSSMPAGAARTPGPASSLNRTQDSGVGDTGGVSGGRQPASSQPEVDPEAGDPRPDASGPPSGQPGSQMEAEEPLVGKPRTSGPEMVQNPASVSQQPEMPEAANPDRMPFWGS